MVNGEEWFFPLYVLLFLALIYSLWKGRQIINLWLKYVEIIKEILRRKKDAAPKNKE